MTARPSLMERLRDPLAKLRLQRRAAFVEAVDRQKRREGRTKRHVPANKKWEPENK